MIKIFTDMDGVLAIFDGYAEEFNLTSAVIKCRLGAYLDMKPMPGALNAMHDLVGLGYDVWIATKPPTGVASAYAEKAEWVFKYLPEFKQKLIITPNKGLLGNRLDFLIDDRPEKAHCCDFPGRVLHFIDGTFGWVEILRYFRRNAR